MQELFNVFIYIYIYFTTAISMIVVSSAIEDNTLDSRELLLLSLVWPLVPILWLFNRILKRLDWAMNIQSNTKYFSYRKRPTGTGFGITIFTWEFQFWKMGT